MIREQKINHDQRPIGVFDSGVGGLSVLKELHALLPNENYVFVADQLHVPYGEKSKSQLEKLTIRITDFLLSHKAKLVVVACNTATCYAIETLRRRFPIPFVGTVPAIKPAAAASRTKTVAVLSTPATAKSAAIKKLISDFGYGTNFLRIGCPGLEDAVESGSLSSPRTVTLLKKYLSRATKAQADQIVLGCTHYPFLKNTIRSIVGPKIGLIDSGSALARQTSRLLQEHGIENSRSTPSRTLYFTTGSSMRFSRVASELMGKKISSSKIKI